MSNKALLWIEFVGGVGGFFVFCAAIPLQSWLLLIIGFAMCGVAWIAKHAWEQRTGMTMDFD